MAKKKLSVDELIRPDVASLRRNPGVLFKLAIADTSKTLFNGLTGKRSANGSVFPDVRRGNFLFPSQGATTEEGDHWEFFRAKEVLTQQGVKGSKQAERALAADDAIRTLYGEGKKSKDETLVYCDKEYIAEIEFNPKKTYRMTIYSNSNKLDEHVAMLQVAAYRQEQFRENPFQDHGLYSQDALMPSREWCEKRGITITPSKNENVFSISVSKNSRTKTNFATRCGRRPRRTPSFCRDPYTTREYDCTMERVAE